MEEQMFQQDVRHREDIKALRKAHAVQQGYMKESLEKTNRELCEVTDMSMNVAEEYIHLKNSTKAELRQSTKKADHNKSISKARLDKLKKSRENETKLCESLDSTTETFEVQLAKAHAKIGVLMEMLTDSNSEVEILQEALVKTREELYVTHQIKFAGTHSITGCYHRN